MAIPRKYLVSIDDTPYYHCIGRCVRRAFLCGEDYYSGKNYDHRKNWVFDRLKLLSEVFAINVCAYAVLSNHYHLVVRIFQNKVSNWDDKEVVARWQKIFPNAPNNKKMRAVYRSRLNSLSWFMRCLNENVARRANREDKCKGRFWEGRFKSQALLDEGALLACMTYVDLNPIRAKKTETPEESDFTSIYERIQDYLKKKQPIKSKLSPKSAPEEDFTKAIEKQVNFLESGLVQFQEKKIDRRMYTSCQMERKRHIANYLGGVFGTSGLEW